MINSLFGSPWLYSVSRLQNRFIMLHIWLFRNHFWNAHCYQLQQCCILNLWCMNDIVDYGLPVLYWRAPLDSSVHVSLEGLSGPSFLCVQSSQKDLFCGDVPQGRSWFFQWIASISSLSLYAYRPNMIMLIALSMDYKSNLKCNDLIFVHEQTKDKKTHYSTH